METENSSVDQTSESSIEVETLGLEKEFDNKWENPPSVTQLKQEMEDALPNHGFHVQRIDEWILNLNAKKVVNENRCIMRLAYLEKSV